MTLTLQRVHLGNNKAVQLCFVVSEKTADELSLASSRLQRQRHWQQRQQQQQLLYFGRSFSLADERMTSEAEQSCQSGLGRTSALRALSSIRLVVDAAAAAAAAAAQKRLLTDCELDERLTVCPVD